MQKLGLKERYFREADNEGAKEMKPKQNLPLLFALSSLSATLDFHVKFDGHFSLGFEELGLLAAVIFVIVKRS